MTVPVEWMEEEREVYDRKLRINFRREEVLQKRLTTSETIGRPKKGGIETWMSSSRNVW